MIEPIVIIAISIISLCIGFYLGFFACGLLSLGKDAPRQEPKQPLFRAKEDSEDIDWDAEDTATKKWLNGGHGG